MFLGYITSSAAPIGALADLLAAAVNPNVGAWQLSPLASEIEGQCIRWLAGLLGMAAGTRGAPRERGQRGELRLLPRRASGEGGRRRPRGGSAPRRRAAPRLRVDRDPHLDPEGGRPLRPRDGQPPLDPREGRPDDRRGCPRAPDRGGPPRRAPALPARRQRGHGQHGRRGPARPAGRHRPGARPVVPRRRGVRRPRRGERRGSPRPRRARRGRLGGLRPAQVAVLGARGGLRARAPPGGAPRRLQLLAAVLPLRRRGGRTRARTTSSSASRTREASAP